MTRNTQNPTVTDIPEDLEEEVARRREEMIEKLAEIDDDLAERYLDGEELSTETLRTALRRATISGQVVPVMCGTALRNKGVQLLLDAVLAYLPSPLDVPPMEGINPESRRDRGLPAQR